MSWTSNQVTQNGNSTVGWDVSGSALSNADAIVVRLISGSSGLTLNSVTARVGPNRYNVNVSVIGSGAVAFKLSAEEMD